MTLLGAEARPLRGWQQGAALLDWGFSLPRDASVGRLVEPGEVADPAAGVAGGEESGGGPDEQGRSALGRADGSVTYGSVSMVDSMLGAAAILAVGTPLVLLVASRLRARRRGRAAS